MLLHIFDVGLAVGQEEPAPQTGKQNKDPAFPEKYLVVMIVRTATEGKYHDFYWLMRDREFLFRSTSNVVFIRLGRTSRPGQ